MTRNSQYFLNRKMNKMAFNRKNKTTNTSVRNRKNNVDDMIVNGVMKVVQARQNWTGTMTSLQRELSRVTGTDRKMLPGSPSALRVALNRVVNRLRNRKVSVKFVRANDRVRTRNVKFVF